MSAQYDSIAENYQATKESPLRRYIEAWSFFHMLGDLSDLHVLDLACGEGFYSRLIREAGAARVLGVDISSEMIRLAEAEERKHPSKHHKGIDYICADVADMDLGEQQFDLVSAAYLLHYSPDLKALQAMCNNIAAHLKPGGRFISINENPEQSFADFAGYAQYGFNKTGQGEQKDAATVTYAMVSGRSMIQFDVYFYTRATYEAALYKAGFSSVSWVPLSLDPAATEKYGPEYWQEYMLNPPVTGLVCQK
ncbi:MAG: class I SAM-dependent methyltransferase [Gammaproteobacteria bacterium]